MDEKYHTAEFFRYALEGAVVTCWNLSFQEPALA